MRGAWSSMPTLLLSITQIITGGWMGFSFSRRKGVWFPVEEDNDLPSPFCSFSQESKWSSEVVWMVWPEGLASLFFVISGLGDKTWAQTIHHPSFHSSFSPLSQELCGAGCGGVMLVRLPWVFLHIITFYIMLLLVLLLFFLFHWCFPVNSYLNPLSLLFVPLSPQGVREGSGYLELNFHLVLNHDICTSILISTLYSSEDSIQ